MLNRGIRLFAFLVAGACPFVATGTRFTPQIISLLEANTSTSRKSGSAGDPCTGGWFSSGDCGLESVDVDDGSVEHVQLYCYAPQPLDLGAKAASGGPGVCYIPRTKKCTSDDQCRPGTRCLLDGGPQLQCLHDSSVPPVLTAEDSLRSVRSRISEAISVVQRLGDDAALDGFDKTSSLWSPFFLKGSHHISNRVSFLHEVLSAFKTGHLKDMGETSRSGATFMWSGDRRFIAKTVRPGEFDVWCTDVLPHLGQLLKLDQPCSPGSVCTWAGRAINSTTLNIPLLGFRQDLSYFLILPVTSSLRQGTGVSGLEKPSFFDVKPLGAHSHQRVAFLRWLSDNQASPGASRQEVTTEQWAALTSLLDRDIAFLQKQWLVDYSILAEVYESAKTREPGSQCVALDSCEHSADGCRVLCLNIIDYTLKYDTFLKGVESRVIRNKWDNYDEKSRLLTHCIGDMGLSTKLAKVLRTHKSVVSIHLNRSGAASFRPDWTVHDKREHSSWTKCEKYGKLACEPFLSQVKTGMFGNVLTVNSACQQVYLGGGCDKTRCDFKFESDFKGHAGYCRNAFLDICKREADRVEEARILATAFPL